MAESRLTGYLREQSCREFQWGRADCATLVVGWCDTQTGINGMADWLGRYADEKSCADHVASEGGFRALAQQFLTSKYGLKVAPTEMEGQPVLTLFRGAEVMGIRVDGALIAFRTERGLAMLREAKIVAEWTF
jgi:hypothetical protein